MSEDGQVSKRRVYDLPIELVDRITAFQTDKKLPSEVEAVRRLLDEALKYRDTARMVVERFLDRLKTDGMPSSVSRDVLVGHPLVTKIEFGEMDTIGFTMKGEGDFQIRADGSAFRRDETYNGYGDQWDPFPPKPKKLAAPAKANFGKPGDMDDEIPF